MKLFETVAFSEAQVKKRRIVIKFALLDITLQDGQRRRPDLDLKVYFKKPPSLKQTRYSVGVSKAECCFKYSSLSQ